MKPLRFVTIGLGGYAADHIRAVQWLAKDDLAQLVGVVVLESDRKKYPERVAALVEQGVVLYENIDRFLATAANTADVLMAAVGIHQHVPVSIAAMQAGLHVYCEKPVAATIQEVDKMIAVQEETSKKVAIGFQYIPTRSIHELKARICDGRLGRVTSAKLMCCWPRSKNYFVRNDWTGKLQMGGRWILDSPANNAHAHFLFNLLYLASNKLHHAAEPLLLQAELYRANHIESTDLTQLRFVTDSGAQCFAIFSLCGWKRFGPMMHLECENGRVRWQGDLGETVVTYGDGRIEKIENAPYREWRYEIVRNFVCSILEDRPPICPPELARPHTLTINAMHESCPKILALPEQHIVEMEDVEDYPPYRKALFRRLKNHDEALRQAFNRQKFLSELGLPWAQNVKSLKVETGGYSSFPEQLII